MNLDVFPTCSECIVRWWRWLQEQNESTANLIEAATTYTDREDQRRY